MSSIPTKQIDGDVAVGRNVSIGGKGTVRGSLTVGHNLTVEGWLEAKNIKGPSKGLFKDAAQLREYYPNPQQGWWALVAVDESLSSDHLGQLYIADGGAWVAQNDSDGNPLLKGNPTLDVTEYREEVAALEKRVDTTETDIESLQSAAKSHDSALSTLSTALSGVRVDVTTLQSDVKTVDEKAEKVVGSINVDDIDNIPASKEDAYAMIKDVQHSRWTLTYKQSDTVTLNVGVIDIFSDNMHHQLTEVLTTHYGTTDGGLDFTKHTDSQIFTYWRSYNLTKAAWTEWQEFVPYSVQTFMGVKNEEVAALQSDLKTARELLDELEKSKGAANGIAPLNESGVVSSQYLPSDVDDVVEFSETKIGITVTDASSAHSSSDLGCSVVYNSDNNCFVLYAPATSTQKAYFNNWVDANVFGASSSAGRVPVSGKIYVNKGDGKGYRWNGSKLVVLGSDLTLGEGPQNAFAGDRGVAVETAVSAAETDIESLQSAAKSHDSALNTLSTALSGVRVDVTTLQSDVKTVDEKAEKVVGSINVDDIDNIPASKKDAYAMIKDLPHSRWTLTYKQSDTVTLNVGVIDIFSDNMHHQLTEVLTTHYGTTDGGLDFTKHTDSQIFTYWRSYNLTKAAWTEWQEFVPYSVQTFMGVKNEEVAALQTSAKELTTSLATTNNTVKALEAATEEVVSALQTDVTHLNETMGPYSERESIVLTATATGYVIDSNGAKVAKAGWAMAEFTAEKGNVYLFKPGATDGNVSVFAEAISSVETRGIDYTYTYNEDGTIATAVATYNGKTHSYTYTYDESGNCTIKEGTTVINELPMTYTTTVGSYSPLVRLNANAELPKDGYCRYMSHFKGNSAIKVVVSYKVGSADLTMKVTRDGVLASISTQLGNLSQKEDETRKEMNKMKADYGEEYFSYGVQRDITVASPTCTRIGNMALHKTLPIHSKMRGVLLDDDGNVVEYLDDKDWTSATRDGSKGQVMVEIPMHYRKFTLEGNVYSVRISEVPLVGYHQVPKMYISAYEAALDRTNLKLASVVNTTVQYRGGANISMFDDDYRCQLGRPVTNVNLINFRKYARNRGTAGLNGCGWNCLTYDAYKAVYWLFVIEYATLNSQLDYNAELTTEGYRQGGLGAGVTTMNYIPWLGWFGVYCPYVPCGYTDELGKDTGVKAHVMPFVFDSYPRGRVSYNWGSSTTYAKDFYVWRNYTLYRSLQDGNVGHQVTETDYWEKVGTLYKGEYDAATAYAKDQCVSVDEKLYICLQDCTGKEVTDGSYWSELARTTAQVPRYRGIENPFGHMCKWCDGVNIRISPTEANGGDNTSKVYVCSDPAKFTETGYDGYTYVGDEARSVGWVKNIIGGEHGEIITKDTGGGTTTWYCDYHSTNIPTTETLRGVLFGGDARDGAIAGLACVYSNCAPSVSGTSVGSRLCFIPA